MPIHNSLRLYADKYFFLPCWLLWWWQRTVLRGYRHHWSHIAVQASGDVPYPLQGIQKACRQWSDRCMRDGCRQMSPGNKEHQCHPIRPASGADIFHICASIAQCALPAGVARTWNLPARHIAVGCCASPVCPVPVKVLSRYGWWISRPCRIQLSGVWVAERSFPGSLSGWSVRRR